MKQIAILLFIIVMKNCQPSTSALSDPASTVVDQQGFIGVVVCSRGCYQYVLSTPTIDGELFPVNLDKTLEKVAFDYFVANQNQGVTGYPVVFSGMLKSDSTVVTVPAPNDIPIPKFKARNIELTAIRDR